MAYLEVIVPLFLRKLVLGIPAQASGKNHAATNASGGPGRPASFVVYPTRGRQHLSRNDWTRCRNTHTGAPEPAFSLRKLRENTCPIVGLKIVIPLRSVFTIFSDGYQPEREIQTGIGLVSVKVPKVRAKDGQGATFRSALVPSNVRKTRSLSAALPWLYLKGISPGEMEAALDEVYSDTLQQRCWVHKMTMS